MSYASIKIDFAAANAQAQRLEDIAGEIRRMTNVRMKNTMDQMSANWKGGSASAYFAKAETLQSGILKTAVQLESVAKSIRSTARRIYEAEQTALRLAEQRSSQ